MVKFVRWVAVALVAASVSAIARPTAARDSVDPICGALKSFAGSVKVGESKTIEFRTVWGGGFKATKNAVLFETRCEDFDYRPGAAVCQSLMKHGNIEFSGNNALRAITCLSPPFQVKQAYRLSRIDIEIPYDSDQHGSTVTIKFDNDQEV